MAFLADENVPHPILKRLLADGNDVHLMDFELLGDTDDQVLNLATRELNVLITQDKDFGELTIRHLRIARGVILLRLAALPLSKQVERVSRCLSPGTQAFEGRLTVIEPSRMRSRQLPVG